MICIAASRHAWALDIACKMQLTADEWHYVYEPFQIRGFPRGTLLLIHPTARRAENHEGLLANARARSMVIAEIRE